VESLSEPQRRSAGGTNKRWQAGRFHRIIDLPVIRPTFESSGYGKMASTIHDVMHGRLMDGKPYGGPDSCTAEIVLLRIPHAVAARNADLALVWRRRDNRHVDP